MDIADGAGPCGPLNDQYPDGTCPAMLAAVMYDGEPELGIDDQRGAEPATAGNPTDDGATYTSTPAC